MREITLDTKISDLLNDYKGMKDILIEINPKFKKLNNPILRKTLAKVAGVRQAAIVGGMDPVELLNKLRVSVGQEPIDLQEIGDDKNIVEDAPMWIEQEPRVTIDANELLDNEKNPLAEALKMIKSLNNEDLLLIDSDFRPEPLIDELKKAGYSTYCKELNSNRYKTFVKK